MNRTYKIILIVFLSLILGRSVSAYFYNDLTFKSFFRVGVVSLTLEEEVKENEKEITVINDGDLRFTYHLNVEKEGDCDFEIKIEREEEILYQGKFSEVEKLEGGVLHQQEESSWRFTNFGESDDCDIEFIYKAVRNNFYNLAVFNFLN